MKILATNFSNIYSPIRSKRINKSVNHCENDLNLSSQADIAGRSQVSFTALKKFEFWENDKKFLDVTAKNLRLNREEIAELYDAAKIFMSENKYEYLDDMVTDDLLQVDFREREFIKTICERLGLSEFEEHILAVDLFKRLHYCDPNNYNPKVNRYVLDAEQCKQILANYKVSLKAQVDIFSMMGQKAGEIGYNSIFDLFTQSALDKELLDLIKARAGKTNFADVCLDFYETGMSMSKSSATLNRRENIINKYVGLVDEGIAKAIAEKFDLDMDDENLLKLIKLRKKDKVSDMEVAYRIADGYNLPPKAESKIIDILQEYKQYEDEYIAAKRKSNI